MWILLWDSRCFTHVNKNGKEVHVWVSEVSLVGVRVRAGVRAMHGPALGCDNICVLWANVFLRGRFYRGAGWVSSSETPAISGLSSPKFPAPQSRGHRGPLSPHTFPPCPSSEFPKEPGQGRSTLRNFRLWVVCMLLTGPIWGMVSSGCCGQHFVPWVSALHEGPGSWLFTPNLFQPTQLYVLPLFGSGTWKSVDSTCPSLKNLNSSDLPVIPWRTLTTAA